MFKKTFLFILLCLMTSCKLIVGNEEFTEGNLSNDQIANVEEESTHLLQQRHPLK